VRQLGGDPPEYARHIWKDYMAFLDEYPPEVRHQKLHGSHFSHLDPAEARFLTPELIRSSCIIGTPEELVEQLGEMERDGLNQAMLYPPLNRNYRVIEDFAEKVMARM
jgi:alkanesulfonate monooxygenase SsuD/methylene tetrahydromethanopterin reductase-like flavin-dependent oxidoreductase (luciferase family)